MVSCRGLKGWVAPLEGKHAGLRNALFHKARSTCMFLCEVCKHLESTPPPFFSEEAIFNVFLQRAYGRGTTSVDRR